MFKEIPANSHSIAKRKLVCGVGINDANYITQPMKNGKKSICPFYRKWHNMLIRCYSEEYQERQPTYKGCIVCDEWIAFSSFKSWMIKQDWENNHLDKDIVKTGNKVYSPGMCLFVTGQINNLLCDHRAARGDHPQGVTFDKSRGLFLSSCYVNNKRKHLGRFITANEASEVYIKFKSALILKIASEQDDPLKGYLIRISGEYLV